MIVIKNFNPQNWKALKKVFLPQTAPQCPWLAVRWGSWLPLSTTRQAASPPDPQPHQRPTQWGARTPSPRWQDGWLCPTHSVRSAHSPHGINIIYKIVLTVKSVHFPLPPYKRICGKVLNSLNLQNIQSCPHRPACNSPFETVPKPLHVGCGLFSVQCCHLE